MADDDFAQLLAEMIESPAACVEILRATEISPAELRELRELLAVADAVWVLGADVVPPLEEDRVAIMLGIVPDPGDRS